MDDALLTTREVAELLGVGTSSVKRWADAGALACVKTPGGHRRFLRSAVDLFRRAELPAEVDAAEPPQAWAQAWMHALLGPSPDAAYRRAAAEREGAGSWAVAGDAIGRVLEDLGERWARGEITVIQEHIGSERLHRALARAADAIRVPDDAPRAMLITAEGEEHTLGLALVELVVREAGFQTRWVGRLTPTPFVVDHVTAGGVALVLVSASVVARDPQLLADQAERLGEACERAGADLIVGGRGAWPSRPRVGHRIHTFGELAELLARLAPRHGVSSP